jgi:hypothetical protein
MRTAPDQRAMLKMNYAPFFNRAAIRDVDQIRSTMAEDLRSCSAAAGSVTDADLELLGWTSAQIATHGREATRRAIARSAG